MSDDILGMAKSQGVTDFKDGGRERSGGGTGDVEERVAEGREGHINLAFEGMTEEKYKPTTTSISDFAQSNNYELKKYHGNTHLQQEIDESIVKGGSIDISIPETQTSDGSKEEDYSLLSYFRNTSFYKEYRKPGKEKDDTGNFGAKLKIFFWFLCFILYFAYFIAALAIQSNIQEDNYWCEGDGLLVVISMAAVIGISYFKVIKPLFGRRIYKSVLKPMEIGVQKHMQNRKMRMASVAAVLIAFLIFLAVDTAGERDRLVSVLGVVVFLVFGFMFSFAPRKIAWRSVIWGLVIQFLMGLLILRWPTGRAVFECFGNKTHQFLLFTDSGSNFVFGKLVEEYKIFAFTVLSVILFFSFFIQILYYYGVMQWIVVKLGWFLQMTLGTTACESVSAAANIFLGQTEAPLLIKPYLPRMTKSELHAVMTGGFATIAGSVLAAFISFGVDATHLLSASVMSAPAALAFSKLFYPETEKSMTSAKDIKIVKGEEANVLHAAIEGVTAAIPLVANIAANLITFIAFMAFLDAVLNWGCQMVDVQEGVCTMENIFGYVFMPLAWLMGVPWNDCFSVGSLIGTKTMLNEFLAYGRLVDMQKNKILGKRAELIATYALCGFSNISSIGIQLGGLGAMAPTRKADLSQIAFRAMIAGTVACFLTACVAGTLTSLSEDMVDLTNSTLMESLNSTL